MHSEKSELYLRKQGREDLPGSLEKKLDDGVTADQCYFFSSVLSLIFGLLEKNWSMLVPLHSFSGSLFCLSYLILFIPSLCLPSAGNGNLCWTLLSVEARMLDTTSATHNSSLLRRGCMLVAVVACWEELLSLVADGVTESQVAENSTAATGWGGCCCFYHCSWGKVWLRSTRCRCFNGEKKLQVPLPSEEKWLKFSAHRMLLMELLLKQVSCCCYGTEKKLLLDWKKKQKCLLQHRLKAYMMAFGAHD